VLLRLLSVLRCHLRHLGLLRHLRLWGRWWRRRRCLLRLLSALRCLLRHLRRLGCLLGHLWGRWWRRRRWRCRCHGALNLVGDHRVLHTTRKGGRHHLLCRVPHELGAVRVRIHLSGPFGHHCCACLLFTACGLLGVLQGPPAGVILLPLRLL
jgi:hypothetical protein